MTRAKDISKIVTDADLSGTLDVTGTVTAGGLTMDTGGNSTHTLEFGANRTSDSQALGIIRASWNSTVVSQINLSAGDDTTNKDNGQIFFRTAEAGTTANRLRIEENGDISFYEDTGTTPKLFWDASAESLGIGTASPANALHVKGVTTVAYIESTGSNGDIQLEASGTTGYTAVRANNNDLAFLTNTSEAMRITSAGNVGIGTSSVVSSDVKLEVKDGIVAITNSAGGDARLFFGESTSPNHSKGQIRYSNADESLEFYSNSAERLRISSNGHVSIGTTTSTYRLNVADGRAMFTSQNNKFAVGLKYGDGVNGCWIGSPEADGFSVSSAGGGERLRIDGSGNLLVGTTDSNVADNSGSARGINLRGTSANSTAMFASYQETVLYVNRLNNDGGVVDIRQNGTSEGTISVSGNTVSYNAFSGSHWSRLTDNSKPTILNGTIIETIDEMCDWYQVEFTIPQTDENDETTKKVSYALQDGESVGDTITYNYDGIDYQATIIQEADNKHTKCKISDTADSTRVYGVFADWDNDDDTINDMYVTAVGTHVVRVHSSATVSAGDLLVSNGDGTAKVQDDDIIRSKTIGKVLTNIVQETYDDGSYTVPCALYCG